MHAVLTEKLEVIGVHFGSGVCLYGSNLVTALFLLESRFSNADLLLLALLLEIFTVAAFVWRGNICLQGYGCTSSTLMR